MLAGSAVEVDLVDANITRWLLGSAWELARHGGGTTTLSVVDAVDLTGFARLGV